MLEKNNYDIIIKKPSAMIQTNAKELTLVQRKIINYLIHVVQNEGDKNIYTTSLNYIKKACGISSIGNEELKSHLAKLTDIKIEFNYLQKDGEYWGINVLLAGSEITPHSGSLNFCFSPLIQRKIINPSMYSPLKLLTIASFKSNYTVVLYEFLRDYLNSPKIPFLTVDNIRTILGVDENSYTEFKYFKRDVLDKAILEINKKSDISCSYTLEKKFRFKCVGIQFFAKRKDETKPIEEYSKIIRNAEDDNEMFCQKISEEFKIKLDKIFELLLKHGKPKLKKIYDYTKEKATTNSGVFFVKALEENYALPQEELIFEKEKKNNFILEAKKCYNSFGHFGNCCSTWERAVKERNTKSCFWCQKHKEDRETLKKNEEKDLNIQ
jgi:plasmid replication initiation protein